MDEGGRGLFLKIAQREGFLSDRQILEYLKLFAVRGEEPPF